MSFRKRQIPVQTLPKSSHQLSSPPSSSPQHFSTTQSPTARPLGIRPSSLFSSKYITSTGTETLDSLILPNGLPTSSSLLIEEDGTGNYSGVLLRYFAAEGCARGERIWILSGQEWWRDVPGLVVDKHAPKDEGVDLGYVEERMKIAWRYGLNDGPKGVTKQSDRHDIFCHSFDITQRIPMPPPSRLTFSSPFASSPSSDPFQPALQSLQDFLFSTPSNIPCRIIVPDLFSPLTYPSHSSSPQYILRFMHTLASLLTQHPFSSAMISLPVSLYPRSEPLVGWVETLSSTVIHLVPLPRQSANDLSPQKQPQGLLKVHKSLNEGYGEWCYRVGKRGMVIEKWSLPPLEDEAPRVKTASTTPTIFTETERGDGPNGRRSLIAGLTKEMMEF